MVPILDRCPGTLEPGPTTYSPKCRAELFGTRTKQVSHVLPFPPPGKESKQGRVYQEKRQRISISGVQEKYSMALSGNQLELVERKGQYILKPIPGDLVNREFIPANEHLTMQIAKQVFGIETAANAMIFFEDGTPAYITRRFDYKPDGNKYSIEDFATLLQKTEEKEGENYKYNASYEDIGRMIKRYVPAAAIAMEKFFRLVVFNYLFSNGDAHLKNFSVIESRDGDYVLAPAYDLMCTQLHIDDSDLALQNGLYEGDIDGESYSKYGMYTYQSFVEFAERIGIREIRAVKLLDQIIEKIPGVAPLVQRSFLSTELQGQYLGYLTEKQKRFALRR